MKAPPKPPRLRPTASKQPDAGDTANLSTEEQLLWRHVAQSIAPIKTKPRVRRTGTSEMDHARVDVHRQPSNTDPTHVASEKPSSATPRQRTESPSSPPDLAAFDPRKVKKLGNGRADVEARIDLHGMRQSEALSLLRRFLQDCHARGLKTVLVITGKGRDTADPSTPFFDMLERHPRGVLRRNVPRWLDEPEMRAIVTSFTTAALRHGGDGAFYVQLRRRAR